jgi:peptide/nickel transport system substrate-binding protein
LDSLERLSRDCKNKTITRRDVFRRGTALGLSLPAISGILAGCDVGGDEAPTNQPGAAGKPQRGGTLIYASESEMDILDPHAQLGFVTWRVNGQMFEGLVGRDLVTPQSIDQAPTYTPTLAESWETSDDFREFTFKLREGVEFHDGTEWNEEVAKANLDRIWNPDSRYYYTRAAGVGGWHDDIANLKSIKTPRSMQLRLTFENPFPEFFWFWTEGGVGMPYFMSLKVMKDLKAEEIAEKPVGTGPFRFVERKRGEKTVLARNDKYWGTKAPNQSALLDEVIIRPLPEATTRLTALETGEVDMIIYPPPDAIAGTSERGFVLSQKAVAHRWWIYNNFHHPLIKNKAIRRAMYAAIDREGAAKDLLKGTATPAYGYLTPGYQGFDPDFRPSWYKGGGIDEAKQILADAGFANGVDDEIVFLTPSDGSGMILPVPIAEWVQRNWQDAGFHNVKIETQQFIAWANVIYAGEGVPDRVAVSGSGGGDAPPIYNTWGCDFRGTDGENNGFYCNPEVDGLLKKAFVEADEGKRAEIIREAHQVFMDDVGLNVVVHDNLPFLLNPKVQGWVEPAFNWWDFRSVWLDESKNIV